MSRQSDCKQRVVLQANLRGGCLLGLIVVGLFMVSGCGGGSGDSTQGTQAEATHSQSASTGASAITSKAEKAASSTQGGVDAAEGSSSRAGKHGARIVPPKGPQEPAPTPAQRAQATVANISLSSPVLEPGPESTLLLPATYTCDGKDSWPTLRWEGIPQGTAQLDLFVMNLAPVNEKLFFDWAVAGLDPELREIEAGRLPKDAIVGRNGFGKNGYSICPPGSHEIYIFALYALPRALPAKRGFDPLALRKEVLATSGSVGLLAGTYAR